LPDYIGAGEGTAGDAVTAGAAVRGRADGLGVAPLDPGSCGTGEGEGLGDGEATGTGEAPGAAGAPGAGAGGATVK
jgi:hypothetical protein